jgi:glucose/arabinose dehydrogenase
MRASHSAVVALLLIFGGSVAARAGEDPGPVDPTAPHVPLNFTAAAYARGLDHPGTILVLPNGDVLVAVNSGVQLLRAGGADGTADQEVPLVTGLGRPLGLALRRDKLYVATADALQACVYLVGRARLVGHCRPVATWPDDAGLPVPGGIVFNRDETVLHVALAGGREPPGVWAMRLDGGAKRAAPHREAALAAGPLALEPSKGSRWTVDATGTLVAVADGTIERGPTLAAHGVVGGLAFYGRDRFPKEFRGGAFVAQSGAGDAPARISFVPYQGAHPAGAPVEFVTAFQRGAPGALAATRDGALLVADEARGTLWRVAFQCGACTPDPIISTPHRR